MSKPKLDLHSALVTDLDSIQEWLLPLRSRSFLTSLDPIARYFPFGRCSVFLDVPSHEIMVSGMNAPRLARRRCSKFWETVGLPGQEPVLMWKHKSHPEIHILAGLCANLCSEVKGMISEYCTVLIQCVGVDVGKS